MAKQLDSHIEKVPVEHDIRMTSDNVKLEFVWDPYLNSSKLQTYVAAYQNAEKQTQMMTVVGAGQWHVENDDLDHFKLAIDDLVSAARSAGRQSPVGSTTFSAEDGPGDLLLFAPIQEPFSDQPETDPALDIYRKFNAQLKSREQSRDLNVLWSFQSMTAGRKDKYGKNGIYVTAEVSKSRAQVLLNMRCNAKTQVSRRGGLAENRGTCCGSSGSLNWIQASFLIFGMAVLPTLILLDYLRPVFSLESRAAVQAAGAFAAIITLMYVTDRTHIFEQVTRLPLHMYNLRNMLVVCGLIGLVTLRRVSPTRKAQPGEKPPTQPFLPRDQTDEWKGWMQLLIIAYHYNMAWNPDWFWEIIRLAVASYLFLTGFGHTVFFLQKHDYSFKRFAAVMIRTNLLPVTLAYVMRTRWLLYYYMPLSTFWYVVVYATMAIGHKHNNRTSFLLGKIVASAGLVRAFLATKDLPETVVRLFNLTFRMRLSADFFHHRVKQDQYIVYIGMLAAILYVWSKEVLASEVREDLLSRLYRRTFPVLKYMTIVLAAVAMPCFWYAVQHYIEYQKQWSHWQPYIAFVPVLAFIVLRNAHPGLRNFYSLAFAWLGRYSGEMYVMQDHLWLAGDQEAILTTGFFHGNGTVPGDRWRDLLFITPLYLVACWIIGDATATLTKWFVSERAQAERLLVTAIERPIEEVELGLLKHEHVDGDEEELGEKIPVQSTRWQRIADVVWPSRLRDRAFAVLVFMWFLNLTYT